MVDDSKTPLKRISTYFDRKRFAVARRLLPWVKARYELERQVGPIGYWDELSAYQFNFLVRMGVLPQHRLLDVGCGPLQGGLPMIDYLDPGNYCGIDLREKAIAAAYGQVIEAGLVHKNPRLVVSSTFGKDELGDARFDFAWATQVLCHLDEELMDALFEQISARLDEGGTFLADIIGKVNKVTSESHWNGFTFHLHTGAFLEELSQSHGLRAEELGTIGEYGYPASIALHTSRMFRFTRA